MAVGSSSFRPSSTVGNTTSVNGGGGVMVGGDGRGAGVMLGGIGERREPQIGVRKSRKKIRRKKVGVERR